MGRAGHSDRAFGDCGEWAFETYLAPRQRWKIHSKIKNEEEQAFYGDYFAQLDYHPGYFGVDVKTERDLSRNFPIEILANVKTTELGWYHRARGCDYIIYIQCGKHTKEVKNSKFLDGIRRAYVIKLRELRDYMETPRKYKGHEWFRPNKQFPELDVKKNRKGKSGPPKEPTEWDTQMKWRHAKAKNGKRDTRIILAPLKQLENLNLARRFYQNFSGHHEPLKQ